MKLFLLFLLDLVIAAFIFLLWNEASAYVEMLLIGAFGIVFIEILTELKYLYFKNRRK